MILIIFYDENNGFVIQKFTSMEEVLHFLFEKYWQFNNFDYHYEIMTVTKD